MTAIAEVSIDHPLRASERWLLSTLGVLLLVLAALASHAGWYLLLVPLVLLVVAGIVLYPLFGIFVLLLAMQFKTLLPGPLGLYPADLVTLILVPSVLMNRLIRGERPVRKSQINWILLLLLGVFAISLLVAYDPFRGLINLGRHVQLFALLAVIASLEKLTAIRYILRWFLLLVAVSSVVNIARAIMGGGSERIFGPAGAFFAVFAVVCSIHAAIGFILARSSRRRFQWGLLSLVFAGGLVFTQTRAAWIQLILGFMLLAGLLYWWSRAQGHQDVRRRLVLLLTVFTIIACVVATGALPIFQRSAARISEVVQGNATTVGYRLFLWKLGLESFVDHPILGIGLGQIGEWDQFLPSWRFYLHSVTVHGLGAHNDFISYLAETGLVGTITILGLFWLLFRRGLSRFRECRTVEDAAGILVVWMPATALMIGYFFSTHMFYSLAGMLTAVYFGLLARLTETDKLETNTNRGPGAHPDRV